MINFRDKVPYKIQPLEEKIIILVHLLFLSSIMSIFTLQHCLSMFRVIVNNLRNSYLAISGKSEPTPLL